MHNYHKDQYNKVKILLVSQLPPPVHGSTIMTQRFMNALFINGFDVKIVQKTFSRHHKDVAKISLLKILKIPILCYQLVKNIIVNRPTLVIFFITVGFGSFMVDCLLLFILRIFKVRYVLYMHGIGLHKWTSSSNVFIRYIAKKSLIAALGGIVLGENLKNDVLKCIPDEYLVILPNGIPDDAAEYWDFVRSGSTSLKYTKPIKVLFLANLLPDKGPLIFLEMAKKLLQVDQKIIFVMAGGTRDTSYGKLLEQYIQTENLENHVSCPGAVYHEDKNSLFQAADIFVFPSRQEAFPLVNLEAMQWGLPVVSSAVGAIPEAVIDGVNGYIVEVDNSDALATCVLELINDPQLYSDMSTKGRQRFVSEYSLDAYNRKANETMQFFIGLQHSQSGL